MKPIVLVIGAGPAGLTAALELVKDGRMTPVVLESTSDVGGISRTVNFKGNRMDIGGHRFFSKSDWVMRWWQEILPLAGEQAETEIAYQGQRRKIGINKTVAEEQEKVMLVRNRLSRIYFLRRYFDYPIKLSLSTIKNLGALRMTRIGLSYLWALFFPRRPERSLEDFLINRFGKALYATFFRDYTEKVWGVPCAQISAEWGAQRIKGLSILEALRHTFRRGGKRQGQVKTSLIERFLYPRLGPGQLWEEVARRVLAGGGSIQHGATVIGVEHRGNYVTAVHVKMSDGELKKIAADFFISTMPVSDLVAGMSPAAPESVATVAKALPYRDFITVGLLLRRMRDNPQVASRRADNLPPDNWIYIQESDVRIGRVQVFNNWSPQLVADPQTIWLGLEYFCQAGDVLWEMSDAEMITFATAELEKIDMIDSADVLDGTVIRVPKTYPAYFGAYAQFGVVRDWLDPFSNLFLVGKNGMHRYNNQDHSMLTAKLAVEAILAGRSDNSDKSALWAVNVDDDYHEEAEVASTG